MTYPQITPGAPVRLDGVYDGDWRPKAEACAGVTLDARGARINGLFYPSAGAKGLTIIGGTWRGVRVDGADGLTIRDAAFIGSGLKNSVGVHVNRGERVTVSDCAFEGYWSGVALSRVSGFEILRSGFVRMASDGMTLGSVWRGRIAGNTLHGSRPLDGSHPDAIQIFSGSADPPTSDILIEDNLIVGETQGICGFSHVRAGVDDGGFDRITIRRNVIIGAYPHGIALNAGRDCIVTDNRVATWPGAKFRTSINLQDCAGLIRRGNTVAAGAGKGSASDEA